VSSAEVLDVTADDADVRRTLLQEDATHRFRDACAPDYNCC
jgi:hypothetical protein